MEKNGAIVLWTEWDPEDENYTDRECIIDALRSIGRAAGVENRQTPRCRYGWNYYCQNEKQAATARSAAESYGVYLYD